MSSKNIVKLLKSNNTILKRSLLTSRAINEWDSSKSHNNDLTDEHQEPTPCKC